MMGTHLAWERVPGQGKGVEGMLGGQGIGMEVYAIYPGFYSFNIHPSFFSLCLSCWFGRRPHSSIVFSVLVLLYSFFMHLFCVSFVFASNSVLFHLVIHVSFM